MTVVSVLLLGFFLGMRHATDADHVIAIATIVGRQRSFSGSALIGAAWGAGHTITIMAVGTAIIAFGVVIPPRLGLSMEFAVGIMLVVLGVLAFTATSGAVGVGRGHGGGDREPGAAHAGDCDHHGCRGIGALHDHLHAHGDYLHRHLHGHAPQRHGHAEHRTPLARLDRSGIGRTALYQWLRPFAVGLVHGLAGSAAVTLMVLSVIRDPFAGIGYLLLFGIGTVAGMMLITVILAAPFAFTAAGLPALNRRLRLTAGVVSVAFGLLLIWDIGFADGGLFTAAPAWEPH